MPKYNNLWNLLDIIIYEDLYLSLEGYFYHHDCMTALLSEDNSTDEIIAGVYNRESEGRTNE